MAGLKQMSLKEVAKYLHEAFRKGEQLYRHEPYPKELFEGGIRTDLPSYRLSGEEPIGLYFSKNLRELPSLATGGPTSWKRYYKAHAEDVKGKRRPLQDIIMRAALTPDAKVGKFNPEEWKSFLNELDARTPSGMSEEAIKGRIQRSNKDYVGDALREMGYDAVEFPDVVVGQPHLKQTTVLRPGKTLVKWKDIAGLLGAGGLAAGAVMGDAEEAEASPLGRRLPGLFKDFVEAMKGSQRFNKEMKKVGATRPGQSSSADLLKGMPLQGSTIKDVVQGAGDTRFIHLEDGRIFPTTKQSLHNLSAERGRQKYGAKFQAEDQEGQMIQALKSLEMNESKAYTFGSKPSRLAIMQQHLQDVKGMTGAPLQDQVLVQSKKSKKWFLMPKGYADLLEPLNLIKIDSKWRMPE